MSKVSCILFALAAFALASVCIISEDSSAEDYQSTITIGSLEFNETSGQTSAKVINDAAGTIVCNYAGQLCFTKSMTIISEKLTDRSFLRFTDPYTVCISIEEHADVTIIFRTAGTGTLPISAIDAMQKLLIFGNGSLTVIIESDTYSDNVFGITSGSNLSIDSIKLTVKSSNDDLNHNTGILLKKGTLDLKDCKCSIYGRNYGTFLEDTDKCRIYVDNSDFTSSGNIRSIGAASGVSDLRAPSTTIKASDDPSGKDAIIIDSKDLLKYRYTEMYHSADTTSAGQFDILPLIMFIVWALIIVIIVFFVIKRCTFRPDRHNGYLDYLKERDNIDPDTRYHDICPSIPTSTVRIETLSEVENGFYVLSVDGEIYGFIGPERTYLALPSGTHYVTISTNDSNDIMIYGSRISLDDAESVTVTRNDDIPEAIWVINKKATE